MTDPHPLRWVDNHCHLPFEGVGPDAIEAARAAGVEVMISVGTDLAASREAIEVARGHHGVHATVGLHPHEARHGLAGLEDLLGDPEVVAVGECGLDYHYDHSPRAQQRAMFAAQIGLAHAHDLPLVIHTREAWDDTFAILDTEGVPPTTIFHCFTGGPAEAEACLGRAALLSFSGIVTFSTAHDNREAARMCPLDRLMVETDSPYLAPVPVRGQRNVPANVVHVGARIAEVKGLDVAEVAEATWRTAHAAYRLPAAASRP